MRQRISIHKALASLDVCGSQWKIIFDYFNPQGSREPRPSEHVSAVDTQDFNPQGSREPRPWGLHQGWQGLIFQSTRLSRASTGHTLLRFWGIPISIHKALASLDGGGWERVRTGLYFNPQGSREPRHDKVSNPGNRHRFQSTRLSRASTILLPELCFFTAISIHKALASLDLDSLRPRGRSGLFQSTRLSRAST